MQSVPVTGHPFRGQEPAVPTCGTAFFLGAQLVTQRLWILSLCSEHSPSALENRLGGHVCWALLLLSGGQTESGGRRMCRVLSTHMLPSSLASQPPKG